MGFWPFGGAKKQRPADPSKHARDQSLQSAPSEDMGRLEKAATDLSGNTRGSTTQEQSTKTRRLSKNRIPSQQSQQRSQTAPLPVPNTRRHSQLGQGPSEKDLYHQNPTSQTSLGPETFNVVRLPPTLYARRSDNDTNVARRKSSKRKAEDYAREREVRAMSSSPIPIPRRPQSFYDSGPLRRDTRDVPGNLNKKLQRPSSQISLPIPEVLPDIGDTTVQHSFKVGMFAALSPRPTVKYDSNPKKALGKQPQRPKPLNHPSMVVEETDADKKRIDDLADDLDANGLRELMERDKRRRERKKSRDQARLQAKLERKAERQREEEARKARTEEYVSATASQTMLPEPGPEEPHAGPSRLRIQDENNPFADPKPQMTSPTTIRNPFEDEKDMDILDDPQSDREAEPPVPVRSPLRKIRTNIVNQDVKPVQGALSPPTSPVAKATERQSISQGSLLNRELTSDVPETGSVTGAASDHSSQRLSSWTAFFRRGTGARRKLSSSFQGRSTPSEFSNTSRESFARKQPPPGVPPRTFRRVDSGTTPQRTTSKFREDLPDFPISPPDSRLQSPETQDPPATSTFNQAVTEDGPTGAVEEVEEVEEDTQTSAYTTSSPIPAKTPRQETRLSTELDAPRDRPEALLSQSLASVDSEGSWLSGKPLGRRSGLSQRLQESRSSLKRPIPGAFDGAADMPSPDVPLDESEPIVVGDTIKKDGTWHAGLGRQATLVRQASRAKSKEGLLKEYIAKEERQSSTSTGDDADFGPESPEVVLGRAKSVEYKGGHGRHISAGSARMLDIRRSSTASGDLLAAAQSLQGGQDNSKRGSMQQSIREEKV